MIRRCVLAAAASVAALGLGQGAQAQSAAEIAVEAAKQYAGQEITVVWEAGLQSLDPLNYSVPMWRELTGMNVRVIEVPVTEMFTKILQEHRAGTGAYDALNVIPSWMPDLARAGALEPLDDYVDKYGFSEELETIAPVYRDNQMKVGDTIYGFPDDGDVFVFYYRTDVLGDPEIQAAFAEAKGYDLPVPPTTWEEYRDVACFITEHTGGAPYGAGSFREPGYTQFLFQERFRVEGGRFFDPATMEARINDETGVRVLTEMREENACMPAGVETWGFVENLAAFLQGDTAMTISWPPYGRWAAGYGVDDDALQWVPRSQIAGNVGYALTPGGHPQLAVGFSLAVSASSRNKDAAYLFIQWLNSEEVSMGRVMLPYALRDPFRESHFESEEYKALWPEADQYLDALWQGAQTGLLDLSVMQTDRYEEALRQGISRLWAGEDPQTILDDVARMWDAATDRIGVDAQREAYLDWSSKPNAYPN